MKNVVSLACTFSTLLLTASSYAQSAIHSDIAVQLDPESIIDVEFDTLDPAQFQLKSGFAVLGTEDASCTTTSCEASLIALAVTLEDFEIEVDVTSDSSTVGTALVTVAQPTINIYGPINMINGGSGFVVPVDSTIKFIANVSADVDLPTGGLMLPVTTLFNISRLTDSLFIEYELGSVPTESGVYYTSGAFTLSGSMPFELIASQTISEHVVEIEVAGEATILGSGLESLRVEATVSEE